MLHVWRRHDIRRRYIIMIQRPGFCASRRVSRGSGRAFLNELLTSHLGRRSTPTRPQLPDRLPTPIPTPAVYIIFVSSIFITYISENYARTRTRLHADDASLLDGFHGNLLQDPSSCGNLT